MTDKEHLIHHLLMAKNIRDYVKRLQKPEGHGDYWKGYDSALNDILSFIDSMEEEPVSEELEEAANAYISNENNYSHSRTDTFKAGAEWQKEHLWKHADCDDLPEIDREVVAFQEIFPTDVDVTSLLKIVIAHRPNKYTKVWNSDLGEEQVVEIERHGKGEWNIPDVKYWLDVELPKEKEL